MEYDRGMNSVRAGASGTRYLRYCYVEASEPWSKVSIHPHMRLQCNYGGYHGSHSGFSSDSRGEPSQLTVRSHECCRS